MYSDFLLSLLAPGMFDPNGQNLNAFLGSVGSQLDKLDNQGVSLLNNLSPATADINGIAVWEQILGLPTDPTLSLQTRQQRCMAKAYRLTGATTKQQLTDILNSFSPTKSAVVIESPKTYQVYGQMLIDDVSDYQQILRSVKRVLPAHLQYIPTFLTIIHEYLNISPVHSTNITVTRSVLMNNGGINSTGLFLDGSFKLDGSKVLNNPYQVGPSSSSTQQITVTRAFQSAYNTRIQGPKLDGRMTLNGKWSLVGQTTDTPSVIVSVTCNGQPV